jgi:YVTN family beta-propeller protein
MEHPAVYAVSTEGAAIQEIHTANLSLGRQLRLSARPDLVRFSRDYPSLWALCRDQHKLIRIGLEPFRAEGECRMPGPIEDFDMGPSEPVSSNLAAVSHGAGGRVSLVDLSNGRIRKVIETGGDAGKVRFRKDGKLLMVANRKERQLVMYSMEKDKVMVRLPLPVRPDRFCFKQDGGQLFVSGEGLDALAIVYPYQTEVAGTILAGHDPGFAAASATPDYLFVTNPPSGDVTIIDIQTQKVMAVAATGKDPCFVAVTPGNEFALVLNRGSGNMAVLHIGTLAANRTKSAPLFTVVPVGSGPVSAVVRPV